MCKCPPFTLPHKPVPKRVEVPKPNSWPIGCCLQSSFTGKARASIRLWFEPELAKCTGYFADGTDNSPSKTIAAFALINTFPSRSSTSMEPVRLDD